MESIKTLRLFLLLSVADESTVTNETAQWSKYNYRFDYTAFSCNDTVYLSSLKTYRHNIWVPLGMLK